MNLVIVESPTKARTLSRFLGDGYTVIASYGHVRDLPEKKLGVVIEKKDGAMRFTPEYVTTEKQEQRVAEMEAAAKKASRIYLATDPDREGEAIAWHVAAQLKLDNEKTKRIVFHEITAGAINAALESPEKINLQLVGSQQARRVLDRLVGYKLSPLLWRKVRRGLSAGRVQSVAVRLVVEREKEIEAFVPQEYWQIKVEVNKGEEGRFWVSLVEKDGEKIEVKDGVTAAAIKEALEKSQYWVAGVAQKDVRRTPPAPFTTSTLQQTAANRLGWSAKKTMQVAQSLYEEGEITYHRTDSTNLAAEAVTAVAAFVREKYGREYALSTGRVYKTKSKVAQEAHEAIRPTDPGKMTLGLGKDESRLYELIWKRFVACQMAEMVGRETKVGVGARAAGEKSEYRLETRGMVIVFPGWLRVYGTEEEEENGEEGGNGKSAGEVKLPKLVENDRLEMKAVDAAQKFTNPPARYSDASLIKALEEKGIGRPSTYAPILSTITDRQYVERVDKRFMPTALGVAVNDFLVTNFANIFDYQFTARMEDELDDVANGERKWEPVVAEFYEPLEGEIERVGLTAARVQVAVTETGNACPKCGIGREVVRIGKFGKFLACSRYPECDARGSYVNKVGIACPKCGGDVILRTTKSRKSFFGCSNYPKCDFASWTKPKIEAK